MADAWNDKFGPEHLISLTNEERVYFGIEPASNKWESAEFYSKTNLWYTRVVVFFDGNRIIKVIREEKRVQRDDSVDYETYQEFDTCLDTVDRQQLLPLTSRGKPKKLTASNIVAVIPLGCRLHITFEKGKDTRLILDNPRANKTFPVGEWDRIAGIRTDSEFHSFMDYYMSTCREGYFDKLHAYKDARKVTIKYRAGDIFRMEYDRTHYCYGIITGEVKKIKAMPELPERHSLRQLMMVPIMVRPYQLITEDPDLKAEDLNDIPLGRVSLCGDNDILWGTHTIVDHKELTPDDLEFNLVCVKRVSEPSEHETVFTQDRMLRDGLAKSKEYSLYIEWGFAQTLLQPHQISQKLKAFMDAYSSPHGGVAMGIDPLTAVPDAKRRKYFGYRMNLLNPENIEIQHELFSCLGLEPNTTFNQFAIKYGGLTKQEILQRIIK